MTIGTGHTDEPFVFFVLHVSPPHVFQVFFDPRISGLAPRHVLRDAQEYPALPWTRPTRSDHINNDKQ